jgi:hypothetical protein
VPNRKSGYVFGYAAVGLNGSQPAGCAAPGGTGYLVTAAPTSYQGTGINSFCSDEPGTIHYDTSGAVAASQTACEALPALQ